MKRSLTVFLLLGGLVVVGHVNANLVGVDFGQNPNPTPLNWTASTGSSNLTNLQDDQGNTTTIGLSFSATPSVFNATANASTVPTYSYNLTNVEYNAYSFSGSQTLTISGLNSGQTYPIYLFGLRGGSTYSQPVTITGATTTTFTQAGGANDLTINDQVGSSSSNLATFAKNMVANSGGNITVTVGGAGYYIAGLAIDVAYVPAPSAVPTLSEWSQMLLGLMVMMLIGWHFHRERSY